jgi:hypothetical protein
MNRVEILRFALVLTLCYSMAARAQNESSLSSRVIGAHQAKEPHWKPIATIQNRVPLVASEKTILVTVDKPKVEPDIRTGGHLNLGSRERSTSSGLVEAPSYRASGAWLAYKYLSYRRRRISGGIQRWESIRDSV